MLSSWGIGAGFWQLVTESEASSSRSAHKGLKSLIYYCFIITFIIRSEGLPPQPSIINIVSMLRLSGSFGV